MSTESTGHAANTTTGTSKPAKFSGLAWAALILGIVGVVGSPVIFLNNLTAVCAGVGVVLGIIALFGTKKIVAGIGVILSILALVFTVIAQDAAVEELQDLSDEINAPFEDDSNTVTLQIGQVYNGERMKLSVANPQPITTGDTAMPEQNAQAIAYDITVTNTSSESINLSMLIIRATVGNSPSEQVFDSANGIKGSPNTKLLPGKSITFPVAFLDTAAGEVIVQVSKLGGETVSFIDKRQ